MTRHDVRLKIGNQKFISYNIGRQGLNLKFQKSGNGVFQACYLFESRNEPTVCPGNPNDVSQIVCPTAVVATDKVETPLLKISSYIAVLILGLILTTVIIIRKKNN